MRWLHVLCAFEGCCPCFSFFLAICTLLRFSFFSSTLAISVSSVGRRRRWVEVSWVEPSGVELSGVELSGVEPSRVEKSWVEVSRVELTWYRPKMYLGSSFGTWSE